MTGRGLRRSFLQRNRTEFFPFINELLGRKLGDIAELHATSLPAQTGHIYAVLVGF